MLQLCVKTKEALIQFSNCSDWLSDDKGRLLIEKDGRNVAAFESGAWEYVYQGTVDDLNGCHYALFSATGF